MHSERAENVGQNLTSAKRCMERSCADVFPTPGFRFDTDGVMRQDVVIGHQPFM